MKSAVELICSAYSVLLVAREENSDLEYILNTGTHSLNTLTSEAS